MEVGELSLCKFQWQFKTLVEVRGSLPGNMEAVGSFHRTWLWKIQLMEVRGRFHFPQ